MTAPEDRDTLPMFDVEPVKLHAPPRRDPLPGRVDRTLSAGQRLTLRQKADVANGRHPLTRLPPLPGAPTDADPTDRGRDLTCGTCRFRVLVRHNDGTYPKCDQHGYSASAASDCRAWWPACSLYEQEKT